MPRKDRKTRTDGRVQEGRPAVPWGWDARLPARGRARGARGRARPAGRGGGKREDHPHCGDRARAGGRRPAAVKCSRPATYPSTLLRDANGSVSEQGPLSFCHVEIPS